MESPKLVSIGAPPFDERGLALVDELERRGELAGYHLLPVARAELLRRLGRHAEAAQSYREALALVHNAAERRHLGKRLREIVGDLRRHVRTKG